MGQIAHAVRGRALATALATLQLSVGFSPSWAGPLTVDPSNRRWLFKDGAPFFFCGPGDPEDFFHRGTLNANGTRNGDQSTIISRFAGTGANSIYAIAVRSHGGDGGSTENPFVNHDPNQGVNAAVLDQWDSWIGALDDAGVVTFFLFYDDGTLVWDTGNSVGTAEANFIRTVVDKLEHHDHLVWCVAEEYSEAFSVTRASAIAQKIAEYDGQDHPIAVHELPGPIFDFPNDPYVDSFAMQLGVGTTAPQAHNSVVQAWQDADGRYNVIMSELVDHYSDRTTSRKICWAAAMGGSTVMVHGMDVINTPTEALRDCGRLATFFESVPFQVMAPSDALRRAQTDYVLGNMAVGYVRDSSNLTGLMGLNVPAGAAGTYDLRWLDTASGTTTTQLHVNVPAGERTWPKPAGFGTEVALSLARSTQSTETGSRIEGSSWGRIKQTYR
jgi:hypothetical protein